MRKRIIALIIFLPACSGHDKSWTETIKERIIEDSSVKYSEITTGNSRDGFLYESYYKDSTLLFELAFSTKSNRYVINRYYSNDQRFELVRELCPNENVGFEGIKYNGDFYGLSTWWHCNGQKQMEGVRFKAEKIGIWKTWDEKGHLTDSTNFGREELLDSLKMIK